MTRKMYLPLTLLVKPAVICAFAASRTSTNQNPIFGQPCFITTLPSHWTVSYKSDKGWTLRPGPITKPGLISTYL